MGNKPKSPVPMKTTWPSVITLDDAVGEVINSVCISLQQIPENNGQDELIINHGIFTPVTMILLIVLIVY